MLTLPKRINDFVDEYNQKLIDIDKVMLRQESYKSEISNASTVNGVFGDTLIDTGNFSKHTMKESLLKSAWQAVYNHMHIDVIASAKDKKLFKQSKSNLPEFTIENIRATFGDYILDPRKSILKGLAEVFCSLDQSYKSHEKVKVGVKGLPKKVIINNVYNEWGSSNRYSTEKIKDIIDALASYSGDNLSSYNELYEFVNGKVCLKESRGVSLKSYKNGNAHLIFTPETLKDINRALAEYYGDVLPDVDCQVVRKKRTSVSKDLQYYPTPKKVVDTVMEYINLRQGDKVLEPSCGCGRFLDALRKKGCNNILAFEYDEARVGQCREKGHTVIQDNFLESIPTGDCDYVVMNPPFYGKHYAKHVNHALKFLKNDGVLYAILPITARYDHGLLSGQWNDLPVGSFAESGTNINTTMLAIRNRS